ncbi:amidase [Bacillus lacus]|uniref:Amidase n=1 Tax=Metabacillus lacus TaxID=1983721 RepID=A0A7X2J0I2_9BACI|nr:amidase [Metabacillus lacus]MRX73019.1 amidase [Metabacillus lacus]
MKKLLCTLLSVLLSLGVLTAMPATSQAITSKPVATWLWDTASITTKEAEIFNFLTEKNVTDVYLQINSSIAVSKYQSFIAKASSLGISVHALDGAPRWVENTTAFNNYLNWVKSYQAASQPHQRFAGLHLDVEPYLSTTWNSKRATAILNYQKIISTAYTTAKSLQISFGADIPFWFDEHTYKNTYGTGNLAEWIIMNTDFVTIMAYRNFAQGPNGIIQHAQQEIQSAALHGKRVQIGVETMQSSEGDYLSFYQHGQNKLNNELNLVQEAFQQTGSYYGHAVHHMWSWKEL